MMNHKLDLIIGLLERISFEVDNNFNSFYLYALNNNLSEDNIKNIESLFDTITRSKKTIEEILNISESHGINKDQLILISEAFYADKMYPKVYKLPAIPAKRKSIL